VPTRRIEIAAAGDQGFLVRVGETIGREVAGRVRACLAALDRARPDWVVDLVPAYASVLVLYDPLLAEPEEARGWIAGRVAGARARAVRPRRLEVPVWYDPEVGPDLEEVARLHGVSVERLIDLHAGCEYLVYMLGFKPGFPYMGELPEALATPRLATPRLRVPAGSVGIAGRQTGVYPVACPGGWRLLGRTPWRIFDAARAEPFRFRPGDLVRFRSIGRERFRELEEAGG
jgi:inhibitor of KinA